MFGKSPPGLQLQGESPKKSFSEDLVSKVTSHAMSLAMPIIPHKLNPIEPPRSVYARPALAISVVCPYFGTLGTHRGYKGIVKSLQRIILCMSENLFLSLSLSLCFSSSDTTAT